MGDVEGVEGEADEVVDVGVGVLQAVADVAADRSIRALVLTGAGRAFCSGADLAGGLSSDDGSGQSPGNRAAEAMHAVTNRMVIDLRALPMPVVCAINGVAAGGGLGLALVGDVVLAARSAYFYLPFMAKLGIVPDVGSTWFYQRLLGTGRATALTLLGDRLGAEKAAAWGLIWDCVDDDQLMPQALAIARRLTALPAHADNSGKPMTFEWGVVYVDTPAIFADGDFTPDTPAALTPPPRGTLFRLRAADGTLSNRRVWASLGERTPDGICLDAEGAIWVASPISREVLRVKALGDDDVITVRPHADDGEYYAMLLVKKQHKFG